ncbi:MAG: DUF1349 domain-containing protein [Gemmataceae bacterium]|nr:DUF1349 domain-containing protein [Gemmataceae bacterium]MCI0740689.1 DUF1349 domain-containing protein [Gemmataceae bacterium]
MRLLMSLAFLGLGFTLMGQHGAAGDKKARQITGWGEVVDPAGDCKIEEKEGVVSITVPGTHHDLNPLPGWNKLDAPRVLQDVDGDFDLQVLVRKFEKPKANTSSNKEKPASFVAGGLLVWQDGKNFLRFMRAANGERDEVFVAVEFYSAGEKLASGGVPIADGDHFLRVRRKKGQFTIEDSKDGKSWQFRRPPGKEMKLDGKVKVGVAAVNATTKEITHQFEKLQLTAK